MPEYNYIMDVGGEGNRILTKEYFETHTPYKVSTNIPSKKSLTKLEINHIVPEPLFLTSPMWNKLDSRVLVREDIRFHSPIPDFGQGFNIVPTGISVNYRSVDREYSITVVGGFSSYRRININSNCQTVVCIASDGSYYQPNTTTPRPYVWGSPSGFTGNFDTFNYPRTITKDVVTIYNTEGNNYRPFNIITGTFTHYKGVAVPRLVCIDAVNGQYVGFSSRMPAYSSMTPVYKVLEFNELPTQVATLTRTSSTGNAIHLINAPSYRNIGSTSVFDSYASFVKQFQINSDGVIRNIAKLNPTEHSINTQGLNTYYFCGYFRNVNGDTNIRSFARYISETDSFSSMNLDISNDSGTYVEDFDIQSNGKIIIVGKFKYNNVWYCVMRLNSDFSVDNSFNKIMLDFLRPTTGIYGSADTSDATRGPRCTNVVVQKTNSDKDGILIGGRFSRIVQLKDSAGVHQSVPVGCYIKTDKNGNIDHLWGLSGKTADNPKLGFWANKLGRIEKNLLLPNGYYSIVGLFDSFNGVEVSGIHALNIDGNSAGNIM